MKVALVTGSAKDVGADIAVSLAREGYTIVVNYLKSKKEAESTLKKIKKYSKKSIAIQSDVSDQKSVKNLFKKIIDTYGGIDVLINTVGNFIFKTLPQTSFIEFDDIIKNNLHSVFLCCQAAFPHMKKQRYGRIINFGCVGCDRVVVRQNTTPYYIAKTGVFILTKAFAAEYGKYNINVNMISPGVIETSNYQRKTPKGRPAKKKDIANAIQFLLSDKAEYVSGANLEVSGAWLLDFN